MTDDGVSLCVMCIEILKKSACSLLLVMLLWFVAGAAYCSEIKKCQDAEGNWHYGNFADQACGNSVINSIDETGTITGSEAPSPTEEELRRKEELAEEIEAEKKFAEVQRRKDLEVLRIYGSEETIASARDRKLQSIDNNIEVTRQIKSGTLKDIEKLGEMEKTKKVVRQLEERENAVKSYNRVIRHNLAERQKLSEKYISILTQFRESYTRIYGND